MKSLDELERIARAATPGPWHVDQDDRPGMEWNRHITCGPHHAVCFMAHSDGKDEKRDEATAAHIAAMSPDTALKLIADARRYQFLRDSASMDFWRSLVEGSPNDTDAAIDAALSDLAGEKP